MKHYLFAKNFKDFSADQLMEKCCFYGIDGPNALIRNGYWINESNLKTETPKFVKIGSNSRAIADSHAESLTAFLIGVG